MDKCLKRGCEDSIWEFGHCSWHSNMCHVPTCEFDMESVVTGNCDFHEESCAKPMCEGVALQLNICENHAELCFHITCFEPQSEDSAYCNLHEGVCAKPFCENLAGGNYICSAHLEICIKPYCSNFHMGEVKCYEHIEMCGFPFCVDDVHVEYPLPDLNDFTFKSMFQEPTKSFYCLTHIR